MTLTQLAKLAGVTQSTVSKAFAGNPRISEKTREHIFKIAKEHGCFDKYNKNPFNKKIIAVVCPEINSEHYSSTINYLTKYIRSQGALMLLSQTDFDATVEQELFTYLSFHCKVNGIILVEPRHEHTNRALIPAVSIGVQKCKDIDTVIYSIEKAMDDILFSLKAYGHTRIGFAGEVLTETKEILFRETAGKLAISLEDSGIRISKKRFEEAGRDCVRQWISEGALPTAIVAAYDYIAIGVIKELLESGYKVPEDVSVVGIDDIRISSLLQPSLSSVQFPKEELCREAAALVFKKIDNQHYRSRHIIEIPAQFIPRESIGPVKK